MTLIPHVYLPRSKFDTDSWLCETLDAFDPFNNLDNIFGCNSEWLTVPFLSGTKNRSAPRRYRIILDCTGYNPKSIKTEIKDGKLFVSAKEQIKDNNGDYSNKEFRKTYNLPENVETDKLTTFITSNDKLVVEMPLRVHNTQAIEFDDSYPQIVDVKNGRKQLILKFNVPKNVDPPKLTVTCKDLIIKAEVLKDKKDNFSKRYYYKRFTLPVNTDTKTLKCIFENNTLKIEAFLYPSASDKQRKIPIQFKKASKL